MTNAEKDKKKKSSKGNKTIHKMLVAWLNLRVKLFSRFKEQSGMNYQFILLISNFSSIFCVWSLPRQRRLKITMKVKNNLCSSCSLHSWMFSSLWVQFPVVSVLLSHCACLIPNRERGYFLPPSVWCNIPGTWQHLHLSHTNPLVPKNTGYPQYLPASWWKLMYCTCAELMGRVMLP